MKCKRKKTKDQEILLNVFGTTYVLYISIFFKRSRLDFFFHKYRQFFSVFWGKNIATGSWQHWFYQISRILEHLLPNFIFLISIETLQNIPNFGLTPPKLKILWESLFFSLPKKKCILLKGLGNKGCKNRIAYYFKYKD